jgi:thymidylate kinase
MRASQASESPNELAKYSPRFTTPLEIVPVYLWNYVPGPNAHDGLAGRPERPLLTERAHEYTTHAWHLQGQFCSFLERVASHARIFIIEGISGSGKDTFQTYLKAQLDGRDVHDYAEGEVLLSWKQRHVEGIHDIRLKFMKLFVEHIRQKIGQDDETVFLLNRFHLSTYITTIVKRPDLEREYDEIIERLRGLPIHIFILHLDEHEIDAKSRHSERSSAWQKHRQEALENDKFRNGLERHVWQQTSIMEAARRQQIPYSVIKFRGAHGK